MELRDRVILITGASRGIGAATAMALASYPVSLALLARSAEPLSTVAEAVRAQGVRAVLEITGDVRQERDVHAAVESTIATLGPIDILINNAGVGMRATVGQTDITMAQELFATNFWGPMRMIQAVLPGMQARRDGLIMNVSSIIGQRALPDSAVYCASKFSLNALSESMRVEIMPFNVRVVTFYPGVTETAFLSYELSGDATAQRRGIIPRTPVQQVARALVRAAQKEPRDAYATWRDRGMVFAARIAPRLTDWALARIYQRSVN